jgi:hypothetical protein
MSNVVNKFSFVYLQSVNTGDYLDGNWLINPDLSSIINVPQKYWKYDELTDSIVEMTSEEKTTVDNSTLEEQKIIKNKSIDDKTAYILSNGVHFDGKTFSLSLPAQSNWIGLQLAISQGLIGEGEFPFKISTIDNGEYELSWVNKESFFAAILNKISTTIASGRALKLQVNQVTSKEQLDSILDNRQ